MLLTNHHNLPETFINVINRPSYSRGKAQISVTEVLNSPRIVMLKSRYWDVLEQDAADMVWSLFGTAVHNILEHGKGENHVVEERLFTEFEGWRMSGAIDLQEIFEDGIVINDYKVTGAWAVMNEKRDWMLQLNMYAWLVERVKKQKVKEVNIIAIVRDWNRRDAATRDGYPNAPIVTIPVKLMPFEEREAMIKERLEQHSEAQFCDMTGEELPLCTPEDMWEKPTTYALKKEGNVRAKSVHKSQEEAVSAMEKLKSPKGYFVEVRPSDRTRCASFCPVSNHCSQYKTYLESKAE